MVFVPYWKELLKLVRSLRTGIEQDGLDLSMLSVQSGVHTDFCSLQFT